jgi:AcrR family transcriptional regulator
MAMVGRKRDLDAHERLLDAAFTLVSDRATSNVSVDDIARLAQVGKQTIYRWWPTKNELILDALLARTLEQTPFPDSESAEDDFRVHLREISDMFNSPAGAVIKELIAGAQSDPELASQFLKRFWDPRRALSLARFTRAVADGQARSDIDRETVLDALYGVLWARLLLGHKPIRRSDVDDIVAAVWVGARVEPSPEVQPARRPRTSKK